jgi:thiol:disulfide interchange protein DsbD
LVAHSPQGVKPGSPLLLGLLLTHQPGWHTYWLNPGDSGLATQLSWQLPKGLSAGPTSWPTPRMIRVANMVNHGFEGQVLLATEVKVAGTLGPAGHRGETARRLVGVQARVHSAVGRIRVETARAIQHRHPCHGF